MDTQTTDNKTLTVLGYEDDEGMDRGVFDRRLVRAVIDVDKLEAEMQNFFGVMGKVIGSLSQEVGSYKVDTITVSAEVSAQGKVSLLGTGGEVGGKGGLSLTFKRSDNNKDNA